MSRCVAALLPAQHEGVWGAVEHAAVRVVVSGNPDDVAFWAPNLPQHQRAQLCARSEGAAVEII